MKKILTVFFVTLGVIFLFLLIAASYFYIADPLNLKPLLSAMQSSPATTESAPSNESGATTPDTTSTDRNPVLSPAQENALESIGIDPASIPSSITPAQEACFVSILGQARVDQIKAGDTPTATEFFQARSCLE